MKMSKDDKLLLESALSTEIARVRRAANAEKNLEIREILGKQLQLLVVLQGRVSNEVVS